MNNCVGFVKMFIANLYVTMFLVINTTYKIMTQLLVANTITCWCKYFLFVPFLGLLLSSTYTVQLVVYFLSLTQKYLVQTRNLQLNSIQSNELFIGKMQVYNLNKQNVKQYCQYFFKLLLESFLRLTGQNFITSQDRYVPSSALSV